MPQWRLLFREGDLPAGSIGVVTNPCNEAEEVELSFVLDGNLVELTFNLGEFHERCQKPASEPSIGELAEAHEILGRDAIELAHDIWCRDSGMDRALAAQGSTRAMLLVAYPELRKKILADAGIETLEEALRVELTHGGVNDEIAQVATSLGATVRSEKSEFLRRLAERLDKTRNDCRKRLEKALEKKVDVLDDAEGQGRR